MPDLEESRNDEIVWSYNLYSIKKVHVLDPKL